MEVGQLEWRILSVHRIGSGDLDQPWPVRCIAHTLLPWSRDEISSPAISCLRRLQETCKRTPRHGDEWIRLIVGLYRSIGFPGIIDAICHSHNAPKQKSPNETSETRTRREQDTICDCPRPYLKCTGQHDMT